MSVASRNADTAATANTYLPVNPWRSTKAFCAPIATMSDKPVRNPVRVAASMGGLLSEHREFLGDEEGEFKRLLVVESRVAERLVA
jgi:hypothetical protein